MDLELDEKMFSNLATDDLMEIEAGGKVAYYLGYGVGVVATLIYDARTILMLQGEYENMEKYLNTAFEEISVEQLQLIDGGSGFWSAVWENIKDFFSGFSDAAHKYSLPL